MPTAYINLKGIDGLAVNGATSVSLDNGVVSLTIPNGGGSASVKQIEVDFGSLPVAEGKFVVVDSSVSPTSNLMGNIAYVAPTGKDLDELEMDVLDLIFAPGAGQFTLFIRGRDGYVADKFKVNYIIG